MRGGRTWQAEVAEGAEDEMEEARVLGGEVRDERRENARLHHLQAVLV
jgi:hypothetical protein